MNKLVPKSGVRVYVFARKIEKKIYTDDWTGNEFKKQEEELERLLTSAKNSNVLSNLCSQEK